MKVRVTHECTTLLDKEEDKLKPADQIENRWSDLEPAPEAESNFFICQTCGLHTEVNITT